MTLAQLFAAAPLHRLIGAMLLLLPFLPKEAATSLRGLAAPRRVTPAGFFVPFDYAPRLALLRARRDWRWHVGRVLCIAYLIALAASVV